MVLLFWLSYSFHLLFALSISQAVVMFFTYSRLPLQPAHFGLPISLGLAVRLAAVPLSKSAQCSAMPCMALEDVLIRLHCLVSSASFLAVRPFFRVFKCDNESFGFCAERFGALFCIDCIGCFFLYDHGIFGPTDQLCWQARSQQTIEYSGATIAQTASQIFSQ